MIKHTMLIIFRNFKKSKSTFLINLIGLSTGLACAILIYLWVNDELHIDKWNKNDDQIYQVVENKNNSDGIITQENTPDPLADALAQEMPEIEYATLVTPSEWFGYFTITHDGNNIKAVGQYSNKDFFNVFSYNLLAGNSDQVLKNENSIVISKQLALRIFKTSDDVIGKSIEWQVLGLKSQAIVSGVFDKIPDNSTENFEFVLPWGAWVKLCNHLHRNIQWGNTGPYTYVKLKDNTIIKDFNRKINGFIKTKATDSNTSLFVRHYSDKYLYNKFENGIQSGGRIEYIKLFTIVAVFIILIACINFMNLSTAKASIRMKEIGIKKTIGATKRSLVFQYLSESVILSFISLSIALLIINLILPKFNDLMQKHLSLDLNANEILIILGITLIVGFFAGSYPALFLSKFNPITILKGKTTGNSSELWLRKGLVIFQFILSVIFISSVFVVFKQMQFIQKKNLGYNKDNVIYFNVEGSVADHLNNFLYELRNLKGVVNASSMNQNIVGMRNGTYDLHWEGKSSDTKIQFFSASINFDLFKTLNIKIHEGRSFSEKYGTDSSAIIFNQKAINIMGLKDPIGKTVKLWGEDRHIIGVTDDINFESLHEEIKPLFFTLSTNGSLLVMAKIKAGMEQETIERINDFYNSFNPGFTFNYKFLDSDYQALYSSEERISALSKYFAAMAIIISCLGLLGLSAFTAQRRTKEIGIRKVLGSSETGIIYLLSSDFTKLVLISIIIALPISYLLIKYWLDGFAYRIDLNVWYFLSSGLITMIIAWATVGTQAYKAAKINPSECLKNE